MENDTAILVFKTDIRTTADIEYVKETLDRHRGIRDWHVDTDDIDCVLRIVSDELSAEAILALISARGYQCTELE